VTKFCVKCGKPMRFEYYAYCDSCYAEKRAKNEAESDTHELIRCAQAKHMTLRPTNDWRVQTSGD